MRIEESQSVRQEFISFLVDIEPLEVFESSQGLQLFGLMVEITGQIFQQVLLDDREEALRTVQALLRALPLWIPETDHRYLRKRIGDLELIVQTPKGGVH